MTESHLSQRAFDIIAPAVEIYLWDLSFPRRLKDLAKALKPVAPDLTGHLNAWCDAIVQARNGFAHQLQHGGETSHAYYWTLRESLVYLLTLHLLLESGISPEELAEGLEKYNPYIHFRVLAKDYAPTIYASQDDAQ